MDGQWDRVVSPEGRLYVDSKGQVATEIRLLWEWARHDLRARYRQTLLGAGWTIILPVALLAVYGWVFHFVLDVDPDGLPYLSFAWAGLTVWLFFSVAARNAFASIIRSRGTVSCVYFPRELVPLSSVAIALIDLGIATGLMMMLARLQGIGPAFHLVGLVPIYLVLIVWTASFSVFGAAISVFLRDVLYGLNVFLQLVFIISPIMYPRSLVPARFGWVSQANPLAVLSEAVRDAVLRHRWPDWEALGLHGAVGILLLIAAIAYIRSVESRMTDLV